jgi:hypothetical protein
VYPRKVCRGILSSAEEQHDTGGEEKPRMVGTVCPHDTPIVNPIAGSSVAGDADF